MPRRGPVPKREVSPDPVYGSRLVAKLINKVMRDGKKSTAEWICYEAFNLIQQKTGKDPMEVLEKAMANIRPALEVRPRRVGGATYQVPIEVRPERQESLAIRWLVNYARQRPGHSMVEKLAGEILDAYQGTGGAVKKRDETHRMAEANRAFAHYRW
ncbi:30S ribosomal protein S7 [Desulfothermobacter acidiphilus]|uniref:30S ribosomal protein S7 n=1 Tax=Desulfothermobacter acidiphilus TaxID=1938353 RepID=UPI003F8B21C2